MIVRAIAEQPELIETMDLFNDAEDTIRFLQRIGGKEESIKRIEDRYSEWLKERHQRLRKS